MSDERCKDCGGYNDRQILQLPTCTRCFQDSLRASTPTGKLLVISTPKGAVPKKSMAAIHEAVKGQECLPAQKPKDELVMRYPKGVCQKCGDVLAKGSSSYCREHERERLREWRKKKQSGQKK